MHGISLVGCVGMCMLLFPIYKILRMEPISPSLKYISGRFTLPGLVQAERIHRKIKQNFCPVRAHNMINVIRKLNIGSFNAELIEKGRFR